MTMPLPPPGEVLLRISAINPMSAATVRFVNSPASTDTAPHCPTKAYGSHGAVVADEPWEWSSMAITFPVNKLPSPGSFSVVGFTDVVGGLSGTALEAVTRIRCADSVDRQLSDAVTRQDSMRLLSQRWFANSGLENALPSHRKGDGHRTLKLRRGHDGSLTSEDLKFLALESSGIHLIGVTVAENSPGSGVVTIHLVQTGDALRSPEWLPSAVQRPTLVGRLPVPGGTGPTVDGRTVSDALTSLLDQTGIGGWLGRGGRIEGLGSTSSPIYTVTTAVPATTMPSEPPAGHRDGLSASLRWSATLATGAVATPTPELSDFSERGIQRSAVSLGPLTAWCGERGMGIVAAHRPTGDCGVWASSVAHGVMLAHSVFVDVASLVNEQNLFLRQRASLLASYANQVRDGQLGDAAGRYREEQRLLIDFLGNQWFEEIPHKESATRVLRSMQAVRFLPDRLSHIEREHETFLRYLEAAEQAERDEAEQADRDDRQDQQEAREESAHLLQIIAAVFLPVTLVFTVTGGTGRELGALGLSIAVVVSVLLTLVAPKIVRWCRSRGWFAAQRRRGPGRS